MIFVPRTLFCKWIKFKFKKQYLTGTSDHQCFIIYQVHGPEILVVDFLLVKVLFSFVLRVIYVFDGNPEGLTLSVERVDLIIISVVEALLGEVLPVAAHLDLGMLGNLTSLNVEKEMMMGQRSVVE